MPFQQIFPGVYEAAVGPVNVQLIEDKDGWTLFDTGYANQEEKVLAALAERGIKPTDIKRIVVSHTHPDHAGGLAVMKKATGAKVFMDPFEADVVRGTRPMVRSTPSPGLMPFIMFNLFIKNSAPYVPPTEIEHHIGADEVLPIGGGLRAIKTPGHSGGHTSFMLERDGGLLFAVDACSNMMGLAPSVVYDDHAEGRRSLRKLAQMKFDTVSFGHGKPLSGANASKFNEKWK
jgi:glyoxylase-like metal-dependent hydrolase (beta-lactamase superfamily II)